VAKGMTDEVWWQSDLNWRQETCIPMYLAIYQRWWKHNLPSSSVWEVMMAVFIIKSRTICTCIVLLLLYYYHHYPAWYMVLLTTGNHSSHNLW